jgi:hypothetical protein
MKEMGFGSHTPHEVHLQPGPQLQLLGPLHVQGPFMLSELSCYGLAKDNYRWFVGLEKMLRAECMLVVFEMGGKGGGSSFDRPRPSQYL